MPALKKAAAPAARRDLEKDMAAAEALKFQLTSIYGEGEPDTRGDADAYEWVGTGKFYPEGHKKAGQEIFRRQLLPGEEIRSRLDPGKEQWTRAGRNQIAKCAEMGVLRKGWPEDLSRIVVEEETHRAEVIDAEYLDLTPAELAAKGEQVVRMEKLGGPAIFASFDAAGTLERVDIGKFFDRVLAQIRLRERELNRALNGEEVDFALAAVTKEAKL